MYLIKGKPYVKVSNYYKEVTVQKKGNEFSVKPVEDRTARVENPKPEDVIQISVSEYYKSKNLSRNLDKDF